jgi:hypothetical protein
MKTSETGRIQVSPGVVEFRRPVKPGAYVFYRG